MNSLTIKSPTQFRKNIINKFNAIIEDETKCINLEKGIYNSCIKEGKSRKIINKWENKQFETLYVSKLWTVMTNLKNPELVQQIKNNEILPQNIAFMTHQEMQPSQWKDMIERKIRRDESKYSTNLEASTDMFTCRKCKSKKCTYYELQTRSADEPATIFVSCLNCGKNWKMN
jgi:transcription elongation factor S-II